MRQAILLRKDFPAGIKQGRTGQSCSSAPSAKILKQQFLGLKRIRDDDQGVVWKTSSQEGTEERLRRWRNAGKRHNTPPLHSLCHGLHRGSFQQLGKPAGRSRFCPIV